jgi:hypothetical protein
MRIKLLGVCMLTLSRWKGYPRCRRLWHAVVIAWYRLQWYADNELASHNVEQTKFSLFLTLSTSLKYAAYITLSVTFACWRSTEMRMLPI